VRNGLSLSKILSEARKNHLLYVVVSYGVLAANMQNIKANGSNTGVIVVVCCEGGLILSYFFPIAFLI